MVPAQIGPATTTFEALATAVGAGALLGSVFVGVAGMAAGWSRKELAERSLADGYLGGLAGALAVVIDLFLWYFD